MRRSIAMAKNRIVRWLRCGTLFAMLLVTSTRCNAEAEVLSNATGATSANGEGSVRTSSLGYPCHMDQFRSRLPVDWDDCQFHKFLFLHAPKTGGESVEYALRAWKNHDTAAKIASSLSDEEWRCALKVSTARNPWARWESWYSFCRAGYGDPPKIPTPVWACDTARRLSLSDFVRDMIRTLHMLHHTKPAAADEMTSEGGKLESAHWFESQWAYLTDGEDRDTIVSNFVMEFDHIEQDFKCLASLIGVKAVLPHRNPTRIAHGETAEERVGRFDEDARKLIEEYNQFEIRHFGYTFPESSV